MSYKSNSKRVRDDKNALAVRIGAMILRAITSDWGGKIGVIWSAITSSSMTTMPQLREL